MPTKAELGKMKKADLVDHALAMEALVAKGVDTPDPVEEPFEWHAGQGPRSRIVRALDILRLSVDGNLDEVKRFLKAKETGEPWAGVEAFRKAHRDFERRVNEILHPRRNNG